MSLDVYLNLPSHQQPAGSGIFVREDGQTREITREEWDRRHPGREPVVFRGGSDHAYHGNITHNLIDMANEAAGLYYALWRPEEIGVTTARQLLPLLCDGLKTLWADPERFRALNPANGWGTYEGLVRFVANYLKACVEYPDAAVEVSR